MFDAKAITLIISDLATNEFVKVVIVVATGPLSETKSVCQAAFVTSVYDETPKMILRGGVKGSQSIFQLNCGEERFGWR